MSDLHGCYEEFIQMLTLINFSKDDTLYILGDIFDRSSNPLKILDYIIDHKNIVLLKGNHEKMFEDYYENNDIYLWYYNGGQITHEQILQRDEIFQESLYKYIKSLPYIKVVDKFILTHASVYLPKNADLLDIQTLLSIQEEDICLWDRSSIGKERQYKDYTIICGHTPVQSIVNTTTPKILKRNNTIYIDCGCVFKQSNGKLACLRLDDMKEFYI